MELKKKMEKKSWEKNFNLNIGNQWSKNEKNEKFKNQRNKNAKTNINKYSEK